MARAQSGGFSARQKNRRGSRSKGRGNRPRRRSPNEGQRLQSRTREISGTKRAIGVGIIHRLFADSCATNPSCADKAGKFSIPYPALIFPNCCSNRSYVAGFNSGKESYDLIRSLTVIALPLRLYERTSKEPA